MEYGIATVFSQNRGEKAEIGSFDGRHRGHMRLMGLYTGHDDERKSTHGQANVEHWVIDQSLVRGPNLGGVRGGDFLGRKLGDSF